MENIQKNISSVKIFLHFASMQLFALGNKFPAALLKSFSFNDEFIHSFFIIKFISSALISSLKSAFSFILV